MALVVYSLICVFAIQLRKKSRAFQDLQKALSYYQPTAMLSMKMRFFGLSLVHPFYSFFMKLRMTPNQVTVIGVLITCVACAVFVFLGDAFPMSRFAIFGWLIVFGGMFDMIDGMLAKLNNRTSKRGAFFDSCMDRVSEAIVFGTLAWVYRDSVVLIIVMFAFAGAQLTSYVRGTAEKFGCECKGGTLQRPERILLLSLGGILTPLIAAGIQTFWHDIGFSFSELTMWIYAVPITLIAIFANITVIQRILIGLRDIQD